jgi:hypothetical protein
VKVGTPFGEFPFVYRRFERTEDGLAIVGTVAGVDSRVVIEPADAKWAALALGVPVALTALVVGAACRRR